MVAKQLISYELFITALNNEGKGVAHYQDKTILVESVLVGEKVLVQYNGKKRPANVLEILEPASLRIQPKCAVFGICGGCVWQHTDVPNQLTIKQKTIADYFQHYANLTVKCWLEPIVSSPWHYRHKARLAVRFVHKKNTVLIGFRERHSHFVTQMDNCEVLHQKVAKLLPAMQQCFNTLSGREFMPQIEMAVDDDDTVVLVLRHLKPLSVGDIDTLHQFAKVHDIHWQLQAKGLDSIVPLANEVSPVLRYRHPQHQISIDFLASDFTQVNFEINRQMVNQALQLLNVNENDRVLDLFCGLGNFSLPLARYAQAVVGVDGDQGLIERAKANAEKNDLVNVDFFSANLFTEPSAEKWYRLGHYNKALIDPARSGAEVIIDYLPQLGVEELVYVSCNPITLARDGKKLLDLGFSLSSIGMIDMFSHTAHIETMALFIKR